MLLENFSDELGRAFFGAHDSNACPFVRQLFYTFIFYFHEIEIGDVEHLDGVGAFHLETAEILFIAHIQKHEIFFANYPLVEFAGTIGEYSHG